MKLFTTCLKKTIITLTLIFSAYFMAYSQPKLSSHPSATATIFLDFDGHYVEATLWNGGKSFYCEPAGLTNAQITEVFHRVSEDFRPFDVNITTDSTVYLAAPLSNRVRIVITPTSDWYKGVGGVSFTRSFTWGDGTPAFVFPDRLLWSPKIIAECCSHEAGHTLGLSHQAKYNENCSLVTVYNEGVGSGEIAWAPVMGNSYYRNMTSWNNGPTPNGCYSEQDNLSIITGINGFGYRPDDHADHPRQGATPLLFDRNHFQAAGIITTNEDKDAFGFDLTEAGELSLKVKPFSVGPNNAGANLDVKVVLMNYNYEVIETFNPQDRLDVEADLTLSPGKYYILVQGDGNINISNYGSLGSYTVTGNFRPMSVMAVQKLELKGTTADDQHKLVWDLVCDEGIRTQTLEVSYNGHDFKNLTSLTTDSRKFTYNPLQQSNAFYRIRIETVTGSISYSNIVEIKQTGTKNNIVLKSTLISDKIEMNSDRAYQYILTDMNGKILRKGNGSAGYNVINIPNSPDGVYIVQIIINSQRITHRVVKM